MTILMIYHLASSPQEALHFHPTLRPKLKPQIYIYFQCVEGADGILYTVNEKMYYSVLKIQRLCIFSCSPDPAAFLPQFPPVWAVEDNPDIQ